MSFSITQHLRMLIWFQSNHIYFLWHQKPIPFSSLQFHLITLRHYIESRNLGQVGAPAEPAWVKRDQETCKMLKDSARENCILAEHFIENLSMLLQIYVGFLHFLHPRSCCCVYCLSIKSVFNNKQQQSVCH